jgi:WhiB family transcriptional regulator, redox-sensing transcriptional regulator
MREPHAEILEVPSMAWGSRARCAAEDPTLFFPNGDSPGTRAKAAEAKKLCLECGVRLECLRWAIETGQEEGIWGGLGVRELRRHRRGLRSAHQPAPGRI